MGNQTLEGAGMKTQLAITIHSPAGRVGRSGPERAHIKKIRSSTREREARKHNQMVSIPFLLAILFLWFAPLPLAAQDIVSDPPQIILVIGAPGNAEYEEQFSEWSKHWTDVAAKANASLTTIGKSAAEKLTDLEQLKAAISGIPHDSNAPLWIVMIGHGTYARQVAKFNMRGPDVSAAELAQWLQPVKRPTVVVNCASSSAPFINELSGKDRIVVTATKSGTQYNFARFGEYFSRAIASPDSDLDHDDEVSVHEAFLRAGAEVRQFYDSEARIATENALIDDNGDGRGTPAKMFRGVRPVGKAKQGQELDGRVAIRIALTPAGTRLPFTEQERQRRDEIEKELEQLRSKKANLSEQDYDAAIEPLLVELAKIYQAAEARK